MTETAVPGADPDRVRHRRLARPGRRGVHVRERAPLRGRRRALRRGARRPGEGRRHRLRPAVRLGALRAGRGRGPARPRHPGRDQPDRGPDPDELVRGRPARRGGGHRDHGLAQPVDRQRVQGQVADGRRGRARTCCRRSRPAIDANAGEAIERRPLEDAEAAGLVEWFDPFEGYQRFVGRTLDLEALRAADVSVLVEPLYGAGSGWIPRLLAGGRIRVTEIHSERNPYFGGINPEPIRPNVDEALALIAGGGYDLGLLLDGDADRAGAADERGTFLHQLEVTSLLMYYLAEYRGMRDPVVVSVNNTSTVGDARAALRDRDLRGPGRLQVHRAEDDRDGRDAGRRGVRRVRVRDAPARARRHLRRPVPARPVPARARAWPCAGVARRWPRSTSSPGRRSTAGSTSTSTGPRTTPSSSACWSASRESPPTDARRRGRSRGPSGSTPATASSGSSPTGRGCSSGPAGTEPLVRVYTEATRPELRDVLVVAGEQLVAAGRMTRAASRRQAVGPRADLGAHRPLLRQGHRGRGGPAGCRSSGTSARTRACWSCRAGSSCTSRTTTGSSRSWTSARASRGTSRRTGSTGSRRKERVELVEVSTPELDDVERLEDDYGREGTSAP